jgi:hypothetical protein
VKGEKEDAAEGGGRVFPLSGAAVGSGNPKRGVELRIIRDRIPFAGTRQLGLTSKELSARQMQFK